VELESICTRCKNKGTCIIQEGAKIPILYCEKFELVPNQKNQEQNNTMETKEELSSTEYTGLCINCDNKEDCNIRCETSVIWHCEKYA